MTSPLIDRNGARTHRDDFITFELNRLSLDRTLCLICLNLISEKMKLCNISTKSANNPCVQSRSEHHETPESLLNRRFAV
jgi:hypothetical protein